MDKLIDRLLVRVPQDLKKKFQKLCSKEYKSVSEKIRELMAQAIKIDKQ